MNRHRRDDAIILAGCWTFVTGCFYMMGFGDGAPVVGALVTWIVWKLA